MLVTQALILLTFRDTIVVGAGALLRTISEAHTPGAGTQWWGKRLCNMGPGRVEAPRSAQEARSQSPGLGRSQRTNDMSCSFAILVGLAVLPVQVKLKSLLSLFSAGSGWAGLEPHTGSLGPRIMGEASPWLFSRERAQPRPVSPLTGGCARSSRQRRSGLFG